jgi:O-antigen biosynthesis protein
VSYLSTDAERNALRSMPLDSAFRGVPFDRIKKRLQEERSLAEGGHLPNCANILAVVIVLEHDDEEALRGSIESVALQSLGVVRCVLVAQDHERAAGAERFVAKLKTKPKDLQVWVGFEFADRKVLQEQRMVTFLRHGDRLHPSAAHSIAVAQTRDALASVLCWGELQPSADGSKLLWAQRNPALHRAALQHWPYLRNAFAVASRHVAQYPGDLARELVHNNLHLFQVWLSLRPDVAWGLIPEAFLIRANHRAEEALEHVARAAFRDYAETYAQAFKGGAYDFQLLPSDSPAPYRLRPRRAPAVVSVIIPFRDKPELTASAARSIFAQRFSGFVDVVLVDNQSKPDSLQSLKAVLAKELKGGRCRIITYDKPFNHSDQCNRGAAAGLGDILVFFNNDAVLETPGALEEMAAWAASPGIGAVGVCMRNPSDRREAAGMSLRLQPTAHFDSIVEETSDAVFTPFVREVFGNTFGCTAVSREAFMAAGQLDPVSFPNGYNDVDFACRLNRLGRTSLSLGHLVASHAPGESRGRVDETSQKTLLRTLYPETSAMVLSELKLDTVLMASAKQLAAPPFRSRATPLIPSDPSLQRRPFLKRMAGRLAESAPVQRALRNPTIYRIARKTYKFILR